MNPWSGSRRTRFGHSLHHSLTSGAASKGWRRAWMSAAMVLGLYAGSMSAGVSSAGHPVLADTVVAAGPSMSLSASEVTVAEPVPPDGVVDVIADGGDGTAQAGTGIVIGAEGLVVTAAHVVDGTRAWVGSPAGSWSSPATVLGADDDHDVAVLRLPGITLLPARLGDPATLREGDQVSVVGNAGGLGTVRAVTAQVSDLEAVIPCTAPASDSGPAPEIIHLIETDSGVVPGDSGGVLLNNRGRVVAMILAYTPAPGGEYAAGRGYAIPIPRVLRAAAQILGRHRTGRR